MHHGRRRHASLADWSSSPLLHYTHVSNVSCHTNYSLLCAAARQTRLLPVFVLFIGPSDKKYKMKFILLRLNLKKMLFFSSFRTSQLKWTPNLEGIKLTGKEITENSPKYLFSEPKNNKNKFSNELPPSPKRSCCRYSRVSSINNKLVFGAFLWN